MKYHIITLGCPKNSVDSEGMDSILSAQGHAPVTELQDADLVIVNTCSFIAAARDETIQVLREIGQNKKPNQRLIAAGCMAQSHGDIVKEVPGVDAILGTQQWMQIGELVGAPNTPKQGGFIPLQTGSSAIPLTATPKVASMPVLELSAVAPAAPAGEALPPTPEQESSYADWRTAPVKRMASSPSAYLKISDGCNLRCAFCTIPSFKGNMRSKAMGAILGEAQELASRGVSEIVLVAQHLTDYGRDLRIKDGLATLLDELCQVLPENIWIRLMYAYPHGISEKLIQTMADHKQICAYLDMPLQHAHPDTLRRMRRPPDTDRTKGILRDLRAAMPDIALRSTFIVGFPGETDAEFKTLLKFLEEVELDRVGAFRFSKEPGTHAATLPDQVRPRVIERRWHELMQLQQGISLSRNRRWKGRTIEMLVEGEGETDDGKKLAVGRSFRDAPEVDGQVFAWGQAPVGSIVKVKVTQPAEYDLWGKLVK